MRSGEKALEGKSTLQTILNLPKIAKNAVNGLLGDLNGPQRSSTKLVERPACTPVRPIESQRRLPAGDSQLEGKSAKTQKSISKLPLALTRSKSVLGSLESQPAIDDPQNLGEGERAQSSALAKPG